MLKPDAKPSAAWDTAQDFLLFQPEQGITHRVAMNAAAPAELILRRKTLSRQKSSPANGSSPPSFSTADKPVRGQFCR